MVKTWASVLLVLLCASVTAFAGRDNNPGLMPTLTPRRLHRLRLEKDRQTVRWEEFDNRVQSVPDSTERGFELALYYAVTGDEQRGREAIAWGVAHPDKTRQRAIIANWCAKLLSDDERKQLGSSEAKDEPAGSSEDGLSPNERAAVLLLAPPPAEFEHPSWQAHVRALALVADNPNLPNTQFLQSWVLRSDQMIREGTGVGYEFFWADPYLPGVSYQNMDPWIYTKAGLLARTDWTEHACWVSISTAGVKQQGCPPDWHSKPMSFGRLKLLPMSVQERCLELEPLRKDAAIIVQGLQPDQKMTYRYEKKPISIEADAAGMLRLPTNVEGKVCVVR